MSFFYIKWYIIDSNITQLIILSNGLKPGFFP